LLYTITRTLSQRGLTIARAKISTEGTRAIDSFYVGKLLAPDALKDAREALEAAVDSK
jgi:UTP:GlnB (protein PII) uridylyltransferase